MTNYRRLYIPGASWFFTVNLAKRKNHRLLTDNVDLLRQSFLYVKEKHAYRMDAVVILPDHLHCIWTLPHGDTNFSMRWNLLKGHFSRAIDIGERVSYSRSKRRERGIWQRRFWEHLIRDEQDFNRHLDYIHWNPVKHGYGNRVSNWPYSSFHEFVKDGFYQENWGCLDAFDLEAGE